MQGHANHPNESVQFVFKPNSTAIQQLALDYRHEAMNFGRQPRAREVFLANKFGSRGVEKLPVESPCLAIEGFGPEIVQMRRILSVLAIPSRQVSGICKTCGLVKQVVDERTVRHKGLPLQRICGISAVVEAIYLEELTAAGLNPAASNWAGT